MGVTEHAVWIEADPDEVWCVYVDPRRIPEWQTGSPVIDDVHLPRGAGLLGRVVELAMLGRGEGVKELARLKALVEDGTREP